MPKLSQSHVRGDTAIPLIDETIGVHFDKVVARWPDSEALVVRHQGIRWTFSELQKQVDNFASGLLGLGLVPGDRIGIWSPNNAEWVVTQFATAKAGLILVNINPAYRLFELQYALNKVGCKVLITASEFKSRNYADMLHELAPELVKCSGVDLRAAKLPTLKAIICLSEISIRGMLRFADIPSLTTSAHRQQLARLSDMLRFNDAVNIQFTSGITGFPKGATLTHHNVLNNGRSHASSHRSKNRGSEGHTVAPGTTGELLTRGYSVMLGYWNDEERTAETLDSEGWMHSGDLATIDEDGYCNIVGRLKDMVIRGGENIYPREIEEFLYRHPKVQEVQVFGVPDRGYGEELCAWIKLRKGSQDPNPSDHFSIQRSISQSLLSKGCLYRQFQVRRRPG